jgi:hypothetical protein
MKSLLVFLATLLLIGCESNQKEMKKIIFLHHSTGKNIWLGSTNKYLGKLTNRSDVSQYFKTYNRKNNTNYVITEQKFPKLTPYGWKNYPYDYYNIWVKNAGNKPFMEEPTLEMLTKEYDVIIFKHCYDVSRILPDSIVPDINSERKSLENYKLQYIALKNKMHEFPKNKFIVWTPAVFVKNQMNEEEALRTQQFYKWILEEWDEQGDNIFVWDFYKYETEGGLFMLDKYADGPDNSHPGRDFSAEISPLFSKFVIEVINGIQK